MTMDFAEILVFGFFAAIVSVCWAAHPLLGIAVGFVLFLC
jgi:hypothetical protein